MEYVSPEILLGSPYDVAVDLWSLGVMCYELSTGHPPFERKNTVKEFVAGMMRRVRYPPGLDPEAQEFIERSMALRAEDRLDVASLLGQPWIQAAKQAFLSLPKKLAGQWRALLTG